MKNVALIMGVLLVVAIPLYDEGNTQLIRQQTQGEVINITPIEVWNMLQDEEDGRQIPIDDRTFNEYFTERIATPHSYDKPILYPLQLIEKPFFMQIFINFFDGKEIIIYCRSANRSYIGANLLLDNGYQGNIYNMIGGINQWKAEGLPTVKGLGIGG